VKSRLFRGRRILQQQARDYAVEMGYLKLAPDRRLTKQRSG
jgi:hypothetical protein